MESRKLIPVYDCVYECGENSFVFSMENYVLMKSGKKMNQVKEILAESGRSVVMVENCGMENEQIYQGRRIFEETDSMGEYLTTVIVRK